MVINVNNFVFNCVCNGSINWICVNGWIYLNVIKRSGFCLFIVSWRKVKILFYKGIFFYIYDLVIYNCNCSSCVCFVIFLINKVNRSWLYMDCICICYCKSVEFICSVGKVIFNRLKYIKGWLVYLFYFKWFICIFFCRMYFSFFYWWNCFFYGVIFCYYVLNG